MLKKVLTRWFKRESRVPSPYAAYYKVLEIKPGASPGAVKTAYEEQALKLKTELERLSYDVRLKQRMEELIRELDDAYRKVLVELKDVPLK